MRIMIGCFVLIAVCFSAAQTSHEFHSKYGEPDIERFTARPGIANDAELYRANANSEEDSQMLSSHFLSDFKQRTEAKWHSLAINPAIYGFQFQRGTRWNQGLSDQEIAEYENVLNMRFPHDFKEFLGAMNGTDLPTVNVYGNSGTPLRQSVGVYSYPRDIEIIKWWIEKASTDREELRMTLADQGFHLAPEAKLMPIYVHRYVVCTSDLDSSVVLSIQDSTDVIVYGSCLQEYLENEFLVRSY